MIPPQRLLILLLIPHLGGGGSEHVIETLARSLNPFKYEVHLALFNEAHNSTEELPSTVHVH